MTSPHSVARSSALALTLYTFGLLCAGRVSGNPTITEFLAVNDSLRVDQDGEFNDWIELHNPTGAPIDLDGYYLTDNSGNLTKWRLPAVNLNPGAYQIVYASGKDRANPGSELHTGFKLDGGGEYLALVAPDGATVVSEFAPAFPKQFTDVSYGTGVSTGVVTTELPIALGHSAHYFVPIDGEPPGGDWRLPGYDHSTWGSGETAFGFGYPGQPIGADGDLSPAMRNLDEGMFHGGVYVRLPFEVADPGAVLEMTLRMKYDDGFAAYLNGDLVASVNSPAPLSSSSTATGSTEVGDGDPFESFGVAFAGKLVAGTNILAIHGLNLTHGGSDFLLFPELDMRVRDPSQDLTLGYFDIPTPGAPNGTAVPGFIKDTKFSVDRGFFDAPFQLEIATETPGVEIRYTTDGSTPTESHGAVYTGPVTIDETTILQAAAFASGFRPSNVDTQTYIFIDDILTQPNTGGLYWDTAMDPNVVTNPGTFTVAQGLAAIPTLSIVMEPDDLFGSSNGIYTHATQRAADDPRWEKPCSAEYFFHPDYDGVYRFGGGFQIGCGIAINGNFSRLSHNPKHSFRLKFKEEYGATKLDYPLFSTSPVDEYDTITIRTGHNQGWATGQGSTQMLRNQYARDIQGYDPRQPVADGNHVHLYLNGQYWGLYNFHERPDDAFAAEHWGGPKEEYDGFKGLRAGGSSQALMFAGDRGAWSTMFSLADRDMLDVDNYQALLEYVDIDQLIDYMIGILYTGDRDGPTGIYPPAEQPKNFYAIRRRHPDGRFRFFRWDSEFIFESTGTDMSERGGTENPAGLHKRLRRSPEYRLRFADRVHRHFFNGGAFTPEAQKADYLARAEQISVAMVAESARWGDSKREPPYSRDGNWVPERDRITNSWMPGRQSVIIAQFEADGLYSTVVAPSFRVNGAAQHGGPAPADASLTMTASQGTIYYTTDGSDPRIPDSSVEFVRHVLVDEFADKRAIMPIDPTDDIIWVDPGFDDSAWPSGTKGAGYERGSGYDELIDPNFDYAAQEDVMANETIYMRVEFDIGDPSIYDTLTLLLRYDDGFVAFLNGVEIARDRANGPPDSPVAFDEPASATHNDTLAVVFQPFQVDQHVGLLQEGRNVLSIHALNSGTSSSDFLIWPMLEGKEITSGNIGNGPSPAAIEYSGAVTLQTTGSIKARVMHDGGWSALADATYLVDSEPASAINLVISELDYRPNSPNAAEDAEDYDKRKDFEFVELLNIGTRTVDLGGVAFSEGIAFDFGRRSAVGHLEPGERVLVVKNREAFLFRYPDVDESRIAGEYGLRLSDDGEEVVLSGTAGDIARFTYNDRTPWPEAADGGGLSLVLRRPESDPNPNDPANWRASTTTGGSPGGDDRATLAAWLTENGLVDPNADPNRDGISNFLLYAFGGDLLSDPLMALPVVGVDAFDVEGQIGDYLTLTYRHRGGAEDIEIVPEVSENFQEWTGGEGVATVVVARRWQTDGTELITVRDALPIGSQHGRRQLRLRVSSP